MALAKPTNLIVQGLRPVAAIQQSVQRVNPAQRLTVKQWTGGARPARRLTLEQTVQRINFAQRLPIRQRSGYRYTPARTLTLQQTVVFLRVNPAQTLGLRQQVRRVNPARTLSRLRQLVIPVDSGSGGGAPAVQPLRITLDGVDITSRCARPLSITASEGDNRTASVVYRPPSGPISITGYAGREVAIDRLQGGALVPLFRGRVDVPTYDRQARTLTLACSDLRNERMGREEHSRLLSLTGGIYSSVTQQPEAEGERWVRELMKTVSGSLDYAGDGTLRYRPWALGAPDITLTAGDIHHREVRLDFATRSEVVNKIRAVIEYRWYKRRAFEETTSFAVPTTSYCKQGTCLPDSGYTLPTRDSITSRDGGTLGGWQIVGVTTTQPPESGWYRDKASAFVERAAWAATDAFRDTYVTGASLHLARWVSQAQRETYDLTITAPESADQFGEIPGGEMRFALESRIDPSVFEEGGCSAGPDDDRRADLEQALRALQAMARKQILAGHRKNQASFRYKPKTGRPGAGQLLRVEIGDVVSVTSDEVTVVGFVSDFQHREAPTGDRWTDVTLAVSRVDSAVSVAEDWTLPAAPTEMALNPESLDKPEVPNCGPAGGTQAGASAEVDEGGKMTFRTPSISKSLTDELVGRVAKTYPLAIPRNTFDVEVP